MLNYGEYSVCTNTVRHGVLGSRTNDDAYAKKEHQANLRFEFQAIIITLI